MKGFTKDGKFRPTGNKSKSSVSKSDVIRKKHKMDLSISEAEDVIMSRQQTLKRNHEEHLKQLSDNELADRLRTFISDTISVYESAIKVEVVRYQDFSQEEDLDAEVTIQGAVLFGDLENLNNVGLHTTRVQPSSDGKGVTLFVDVQNTDAIV